MKDTAKITAHNQYQISYYDNTKKKAMQPANSRYVSDQVQTFLEVSGLSTSDEIVEIGCGIGKYTFHLLEKGYQIEGIDLSGFLLQEFERHNAGRFQVRLYNTDLLNAPEIIEKKYNTAIGFMVLHHLHDLELSFKAMSKLLDEEGRLVFLEPNAWNHLYYLQVTFTRGMTWKSEKGLIRMRRSVLKQAMLSAGFSKIIIKRFGFFPPFIKNRPYGSKLENFLARFRWMDFFRPFQVIVISR